MPDDTALLGERVVRQGLAGRRVRAVADAVAVTTAVQAQDTSASYLGVRARSVALRRDDLDAAVGAERSVVRTWLMRGTIHLVTTADLRWLVRLIGPAVQRKYRSRWNGIGLTQDVLDRCLQALPQILADGPLDRHQIGAALTERGVATGLPDPQAHTHVLVHASTSGLVCRGPDRGRAATFTLIERWAPGAPAGPSGDEALAELARRYFRAYSPATATDFTTWSGLPSAAAIGLIRDELTPTEVDGRPGFRLGEVAPEHSVRLLPAFDNYVLGYRDRAAIVDPARHGEVYQGGMIRPVLLIDGRAAGTWRLERGGSSRPIRIVVSPWQDLRKPDSLAVAEEANDVGRFLAGAVEVSYHAR